MHYATQSYNKRHLIPWWAISWCSAWVWSGPRGTLCRCRRARSPWGRLRKVKWVHYCRSRSAFWGNQERGQQTRGGVGDIGREKMYICSPPVVVPAQSVLAVVSKVPQEGGTIATIAVNIKSTFSMPSGEICKKIGTALDDENVSAAA